MCLVLHAGRKAPPNGIIHVHANNSTPAARAACSCIVYDIRSVAASVQLRRTRLCVLALNSVLANSASFSPTAARKRPTHPTHRASVSRVSAMLPHV